MSTVCADQVVDLAAGEEEVFERLDPNFRKAVRKAQREGVRLRSAGQDSPELVAAYYELARRSAERTGEALPSRDYYEAIQAAFGEGGRCAFVFVEHQGRPAAAVLLLIDKGGALFLAGVSDPEFLPLRVNNFVHWEAMRWMKRQGVARYRLGPTFPEVPADWPIAKVSFFKGQFGGQSFPIVQGSLFRMPEKYLEDGREAVALLCRPIEPSDAATIRTIPPPRIDREGWGHVLRPYGVAFLEGVFGEAAAPDGADRWTVEHFGQGPACPGVLRFGRGTGDGSPLDVRPEPAGQPLFDGRPERRFDRGLAYFRRPEPVYHAVLPHASVDGPGVTPVLLNESRRTVVGWRETGGGRELLIGLPVVEELIRRTHGDPRQVEVCEDKSRWGYGHERPNYLYEQQLVAGRHDVPWADRLGFLLAESLAELTGLPLIEPLPQGACGAILLTGDDDEAWLEKYAEQLALVGDFPLTYFLLDRTRHTRETLARLPANVELGLHADALDAPARYAERCRDQGRAVHELCGRAPRTIRNHGFLSDGYLGQLPAWDDCGLGLDVNIPGLDGTAVTGSFLPYRNRRADGDWSDHHSLLTAFGDGMIYALGWRPRRCVRRIRQLCRRIERSRPGIVCANFHPQNISDCVRLHTELMAWGRRRGWIALGADSLLDWWQARERIAVRPAAGGAAVSLPHDLSGVVVRIPQPGGWGRLPVPGRAGVHHVQVTKGTRQCAS
jgi:hypothetical protein